MLSSDRAEAGLLITPQRDRTSCATRSSTPGSATRTGWKSSASPSTSHPGTTARRTSASWCAASAGPPTGPCPAPTIARPRSRSSDSSCCPRRSSATANLARPPDSLIERAARQVRRGMTEMEIAGRLAAEAMREGVTPTMLLVGADERVFRFRHPIPTSRSARVSTPCWPSARGAGGWLPRQRAWSTSARCPRSFRRSRRPAPWWMPPTTCRPSLGAAVSDVFQQAAEAYAQVGFPEEWKKHNQGGSAGYESRDYEGTPTCREHVLEEQGFAWNPSITGVKSEDTIIAQAGRAGVPDHDRRLADRARRGRRPGSGPARHSDSVRRASWRRNPKSGCW